jgi:hypothetical protein
VPIVLVTTIVFAQWVRVHFRHTRRFDCQAARNGDADLSASKAWLSRLGRNARAQADVWVTDVSEPRCSIRLGVTGADGFAVAVVCHPIP